jgi:hypothetical protein
MFITIGKQRKNPVNMGEVPNINTATSLNANEISNYHEPQPSCIQEILKPHSSTRISIPTNINCCSTRTMEVHYWPLLDFDCVPLVEYTVGTYLVTYSQEILTFVSSNAH